MMVMKLDPDILFVIFSLLPFLKAVQCRYVCKSWRTLLDDDFLINIHAKTELKLHGYDHHLAQCSCSSSSSSTIVSFISCSYMYKETSLFGFYDDNLCSYKEIRFNDSSSSKLLGGTTVINSCNGLIYLKTPYYNQTCSFAIYNPVTREFLRLPGGGQYRIGGFGYHPSTKEYKILRTIRIRTYDDDYHYQIYTLGTTGGWREIKGSSALCFKYDVPGVHVNGTLYWVTEYGGSFIMSFDLADEEFRVLSMLPPLLNNMKPKPHYKLVESQGCLFLFVDQYSSPDNPHIELWVMKEKDIDHDNNELALTHSGKVLFWHNGVLTCFDPKEERFASIRDVPASSRRNRSGSAAIVPHTNSLVSLIALGAIPKNKKKKKKKKN